jgi:hypothetical protein
MTDPYMSLFLLLYSKSHFNSLYLKRIMSPPSSCACFLCSSPEIRPIAWRKTGDADTDGPAVEGQSFEARIKRLGWKRPEKFKSLTAEIGFVFSISMSQILTVSLLCISISVGIHSTSKT